MAYVPRCPRCFFSWTDLSSTIRSPSPIPSHLQRLMLKKLGQYCKNIGWAMLLCQFISPTPLLKILLMLLRVTGEFKLDVFHGLLLKPLASTSLPFLFSTRSMQSVSRSWICYIRWTTTWPMLLILTQEITLDSQLSPYFIQAMA